MKYHINLFPENNTSLVDKIIYFSYSYLRYILVVTQMVVIYVFIFRFSIDQQIIDSKDTLSQKQEIVSVVGPLLKEVATVETKVKNIKEIITQQQYQRYMIDYVVSVFPSSLTLSSMNISKTAVTFEGFTNDVDMVKKFHSKLLKDKRFTSIQLVRLVKTEQYFQFMFKLSTFSTING
ncbi:MAG: PilN domain-containing protein [Candidatus Roizmanbacteria bacterium]